MTPMISLDLFVKIPGELTNEQKRCALKAKRLGTSETVYFRPATAEEMVAFMAELLTPAPSPKFWVYELLPDERIGSVYEVVRESLLAEMLHLAPPRKEFLRPLYLPWRFEPCQSEWPFKVLR